MADLIVDTRWRGAHGIGRYAFEVTTRLRSEFQAFEGWTRPSSLLDALNPFRARVSPQTLWYSPGYNAGFTRAKQLLTLHDLIHLETPGVKRAAYTQYYERVIKPAILELGHVLTVSESSKVQIERWLGAPDVMVHVTGNGCSSAFSSKGEATASNLAEGEPYVLFVGNMRWHKNPDVVFSALAKVPVCRLVVVTTDAVEARAKVAAHGLLDRTCFMNNVSDEELARLYRGAAGLLFPSLMEGFGLPVLEALATGCPVLYFHGCPSVREICQSFPGGALPMLGAHDVSEWREGIGHLLARRPTVPAMPNKFTWDKVAENVSTVVNLLKRGSI